MPATFHVISGGSIQAAVLLAGAGDKIKVDAGTYIEHVTVDNTGHLRTGLEIEGAQNDKNPCKNMTTLIPGDPMTQTVVTLGFTLAADKVELEGLTIENTSLVVGAGSGVVTSPLFSGYELEDNIITHNAEFGVVFNSNGQYESSIEENWFHNGLTAADVAFNNVKGDIISDSTNPKFQGVKLSNAEIEDNCFDGNYCQPALPQVIALLGNPPIAPPPGFTLNRYSIRIEGPSAASPDTKIEIEGNKLTNEDAISLGNATKSEISENTLTHYNLVGIAVTDYATGVQVEENKLIGDTTAFDPTGATGGCSVIGIAVFNTTGLVGSTKTDIEVEENTLTGGIGGIVIAQYGLAAGVKEAKVEVEENSVKGYSQVGIALFSAHGDTVDENKVTYTLGTAPGPFGPTTIGIGLDSKSTGNSVTENKMSGNTFDAFDASFGAGSGTPPTANTWKKNKGTTQSRPGLLS